MEIEGIIVKGYSGFYYVFAGKHTWECALRGKYRLKKQTFLVGDRVVITVVDEVKRKAVIEKVLPRRNELIRPPVSNVDQAVLVVSFKNPAPDFWLLDRLLIFTQAASVRPLICFNKADLVSNNESEELFLKYQRAGFPVLVTSTKEMWGIEKLRAALIEKTSVLAGPSGVGKSSLMNALEPSFHLKTGVLSEKLGRGKHTTRHVELLPLSGGGFLVDTPGFSQLHLLSDVKREELARFYPEFMSCRTGCRFATCLHRDEPQCAVREAVKEGYIDQDRYQRYLTILAELSDNEGR